MVFNSNNAYNVWKYLTTEGKMSVNFSNCLEQGIQLGFIEGVGCLLFNCSAPATLSVTFGRVVGITMGNMLAHSKTIGGDWHKSTKHVFIFATTFFTTFGMYSRYGHFTGASLDLYKFARGTAALATLYILIGVASKGYITIGMAKPREEDDSDM